MSSTKYEDLGKGIVKRTERRVLGLFVDGTGLDRATRRMNRKVDMSALVRGVTSGIQPVVARYYTLIPYEDDSRQRAFLDAVSRAGLSVIVKRLPPKGISRQVSADVEMASDIVAFSLGHNTFSELSQYQSDHGAYSDSLGTHGSELPSERRAAIPPLIRRIALLPAGSLKAKHTYPQANSGDTHSTKQALDESSAEKKEEGFFANKEPVPATPVSPQHRIVTVVCPSRDLAYPIALVRELGVDTVNADFGQFNAGDILKSAAKWIDLSDSETIWRE